MSPIISESNHGNHSQVTIHTPSIQSQPTPSHRALSRKRHWSTRLLSTLLGTCAATGMVLAIASPAAAQSQATPNRSIEYAVPAEYIETPAYARMVPSAGFSYFVVSEAAGKLIYARNTLLPQIAQIKLAANGDVDDKVKIPGFSLAGNADKKIDNKVLAMAAHPTKPVLYVWQDVATQRDNIVAPKEAQLQYSHLLVYDISANVPKLLMSTCSGIDFMYGRATGMLTLGNNGKRLFVPNLRYKVTRGHGIALGAYELDDNGLPILTGADPENDPALVSGATQDSEVTADNAEPAAETAEDAEKVTSGRGGGLTMLHMGAVGSRYQVGRAFYIDETHTIMRTSTYLATYDSSNRSGRISAVLVPLTNVRSTRFTLNESLVGQPQQMVYSTYPSAINVVAWPVFQGYPSLMPQITKLNGLRTYSDVISMPKHNLLAVGSSNRVLLFDVDKQGWFQEKMDHFKVEAAQVNHVRYSQKFDRLYVGTDEKLEVTP